MGVHLVLTIPNVGETPAFEQTVVARNPVADSATSDKQTR